MKLFTILLLSLNGLIINAQSSPFFGTYGGDGTDRGRSVELCDDGGYIVCGSTTSFGPRSDIYLFKTNDVGDTIWTKTYGGPHCYEGYDVKQTFDGGYIIVGSRGQPDTTIVEISDVYILKTDSVGEVEWDYVWNAGMGDIAYAVHQNLDSSYTVGGLVNRSVIGGPFRSFIKTLDPNGNVLWTQTLDENSSISSTIQTLDGGNISCGSSGFFSFLVKTNALGDTIWTKRGGLGFQNGSCQDIIQTADSSIITTGYISNGNGAKRNAFVSKIDRYGNLLWTKSFGNQEESDVGYSIDLASNDGFIIAGSTHSYSAGTSSSNKDVWLIRTNETGDSLWTRSYDLGGGDDSAGLSVKSCPDGSYITTGFYGIPTSAFLLKTDSLGNGPIILSVEDTSPNYNSSINIYPNPSSDWITIDFNNHFFFEEIRITLYDLSGRVLNQFSEKHISGNKIKLNVANLPAGVYLLKIDGDNQSQLLKFMKQ